MKVFAKNCPVNIKNGKLFFHIIFQSSFLSFFSNIASEQNYLKLVFYYFFLPFPSCTSRILKYIPQTPTVIAIKSHWVAASHIGSRAQQKTAIKTAVTETMKKMSDNDLIPIFSPPLVFYIYFSS